MKIPVRIVFLFVFIVNSSYSIAQSISTQPLINVFTGQSVVLPDFQSAKAVVIIFTSNSCAYDGYYSNRLKDLSTAYGSNTQFILVNSNQEPEESPEKMKANQQMIGLNVPYLADKDQLWMKALSARKTPEVFVLDPKGSFAVVYSGAIDDNPQVASAVKSSYLKEALDGLIAGKKIEVNSVRAVGCSMRSKQ